MTMMKRSSFLCRLLAAFLGLVPSSTTAQTAQQLAFAGLLSSGNPGQFNAVQTDTSGSLYLLLDQKDGIRIIKSDPTATTVVAQTHIGAHGDIGLALYLDPSGNGRRSLFRRPFFPFPRFQPSATPHFCV